MYTNKIRTDKFSLRNKSNFLEEVEDIQRQEAGRHFNSTIYFSVMKFFYTEIILEKRLRDSTGLSHPAAILLHLHLSDESVLFRKPE